MNETSHPPSHTRESRVEKPAYSHAICEALRASPTSEALLKEANTAAIQLYWTARDLAGCIEVLREAIRAAEGALQDPAHASDASIRREYKSLLYNMASFGWCGWDEPGLTPPPNIEEESEAAARKHLLLAEKMELSPLQRSRAHWITGALLIQQGDLGNAACRFEDAARLAEGAGNLAESMNARAFLCVCAALEGKAGAENQLRETLERMREMEGAKPLMAQASTALRVFLRRKERNRDRAIPTPDEG